MQSLPVIDLSGSVGVTRKIERACHDVGFMYVTGHGISARVVAAVRKAVVNFFALPETCKEGYRITPENYRGYIPQGFFSPAGEYTQADHYEGYKLHFEVAADDPIIAACDLYGPNKWPDLPDIRTSVSEYWQECDRVARMLLAEFASILGIARDDFLQLFEYPLTNMTLLHYPSRPPGGNGFGIHPHKDTDALTILAPDQVGGLLVKQRHSDQWLPADKKGEALIVNIGDLLELWSGGYFVSTPHKVVNPAGAERYSFPYFVVPRHDVVVTPLLAPQPGFARESVRVGDVSREVWRNNWPDAVPGMPRYDLGTLAD